MEFSEYIEARLGKIKAPSREIEGRWVSRIERNGWQDLPAAVCVSNYMGQYGKGIGAAKLVDLARCAEYLARHDIALAFLEVAYRMEFPGSAASVPGLPNGARTGETSRVLRATVEVVTPPRAAAAAPGVRGPDPGCLCSGPGRAVPDRPDIVLHQRPGYGDGHTHCPGGNRVLCQRRAAGRPLAVPSAAGLAGHHAAG